MKYMIEYLGALWLGAGWFETEADAQKFINGNRMRNNERKSAYGIIPVAQGMTNGEPPQIPRGGVRMYRESTGKQS